MVDLLGMMDLSPPSPSPARGGGASLAARRLAHQPQELLPCLLADELATSHPPPRAGEGDGGRGPALPHFRFRCSSTSLFQTARGRWPVRTAAISCAGRR